MPVVTNTKRDCECLKVSHEHGTQDAYLTDGCRCTECREARRVDGLQYRKDVAYGRSRTHQVDAKEARNHINKLRKKGWWVSLSAKEMGVSASTLTRIISDPAVKTIKGQTHDKIMSFQPIGTRKKFQDTVIETTDSIGTQRRIQALVALGFTLKTISDHAGKHKSFLTGILKSDQVSLVTAELFRSVYDQMWNRKPLQNTPAEKRSMTVALKMAEDRGWVPPMAWDDDRIDSRKYLRPPARETVLAA